MSRNSREPVFVVIEGIDRVGKSLQVKRFAEHLHRLGVPAREVAAPDYGTMVGQAVHKHLVGDVWLQSLVNGQRSSYDALAFQCLQTCDKYVTADRVRASLAAGESVVCARWTPSALIYGEDDGLPARLLAAMTSSLPVPDACVLLRAGADHVRTRSDYHNRHEADAEKQRRLAAAYDRMWASSPGFVAVWGEAPPNEVERSIWESVTSVPKARWLRDLVDKK